MGKVLLILVIFSSAFARDPDVLPHDYEYRDQQTMGGSEWGSGDTFIAIALPIAALMVVALPIIFDGKDQEWPVHKFTLFNKIEQSRTLNKFPTRRKND